MGRNRLHDYDVVLDRWQAGASSAAIADALGISEPVVRRIIYTMRKKGDPRAAYRSQTPPALPRSPVAGDGSRGWTAERLAEVERLIKEGHSASQVADAIGGGLTRNAVIGKLHRMGLNLTLRPRTARRPAPPRRPPARGNRSNLDGLAFKIARGTLGKKSVAPTPTRPTPHRPVEDLVKPVSRDVDLLAIKARDCRWPVNDPPKGGQYLFCGHHAYDGGSYCEYHSRLAYRPLSERRRLAA